MPFGCRWPLSGRQPRRPASNAGAPDCRSDFVTACGKPAAQVNCASLSRRCPVVVPGTKHGVRSPPRRPTGAFPRPLVPVLVPRPRPAPEARRVAPLVAAAGAPAARVECLPGVAATTGKVLGMAGRHAVPAAGAVRLPRTMRTADAALGSLPVQFQIGPESPLLQANQRIIPQGALHRSSRCCRRQGHAQITRSPARKVPVSPWALWSAPGHAARRPCGRRARRRPSCAAAPASCP